MRRTVLLLAALALACATAPRPVASGDPCARCHMPVADERFGAVLVTRTGLSRGYDAIECLARDLAEGIVDPATVASIWVVPFDAPGTLVDAAGARYLRSDERRSPMGMGIAAWTAAGTAPPDAEWLTWDDVLRLADGTPPHPHAARP